MENKFSTISCEKDLEIYEKRLKFMNDCKTAYADNGQFQTKQDFLIYLTMAKGKLVLVQTVSGNCKKAGVLLDVGTDFISIRLGNTCATAVIPLNQVDYITVIHNNDKRILGRY